jgi:arylformamidase
MVRALTLALVFYYVSISVGYPQRKMDIPYIKIPDVRYAPYAKKDKQNMMDIYMPRMGSNSPVILFVHGGAWTDGDKEDIFYKAGYFTSKGYVFVSINYRLTPEVKHPAHAQDVANAVSWFYSNARHYSADAKRMYLMGHSAGAHLAALISLDDSYLLKAGVSTDVIKGAILIDGIGYDIPVLIDNTGNKAKEQYKKIFGASRKDWQNASPAYHIKENTRTIPMLLCYAADRAIAGIEAHLLAEKLQGVNAYVKTFKYDKKNSQTINRDIGKERDKTTDDIVRFLQEKFVLP